MVCFCSMFLSWIVGGGVISQLDHKCTWQCSLGQSWLQNLGQQDSILVSCLAQDPLRLTDCIHLPQFLLYIHHKKLSWMFLLLRLQNVDLRLLQNLWNNFDGMSYTTSEHKLLKSDVLKSSLGFVTERDVQHIIHTTVRDIVLLVSHSKCNEEFLGDTYIYKCAQGRSESSEHRYICIVL